MEVIYNGGNPGSYPTCTINNNHMHMVPEVIKLTLFTKTIYK